MIPVQEKAFCSNCGAELLNSETLFCSYCGVRRIADPETEQMGEEEHSAGEQICETETKLLNTENKQRTSEDSDSMENHSIADFNFSPGEYHYKPQYSVSLRMFAEALDVYFSIVGPIIIISLIFIVFFSVFSSPDPPSTSQ